MMTMAMVSITMNLKMTLLLAQTLSAPYPAKETMRTIPEMMAQAANKIKKKVLLKPLLHRK